MYHQTIKVGLIVIYIYQQAMGSQVRLVLLLQAVKEVEENINTESLNAAEIPSALERTAAKYSNDPTSRTPSSGE